MPKTRLIYRGYSALSIKSRSSIPTDQSNIVVDGDDILFSNISLTEMAQGLGIDSPCSIADVFSSLLVNKHSAFGPYCRRIVGTPDIRGIGATIAYAISSPYRLADIAGYNHTAPTPAITNSDYADVISIPSGSSAVIWCDVTIGEMPLDLADIGDTALGLAFIIWNGNTYVDSQVKSLLSLQDSTTFSITVPNITASTNYTCQIRLLRSATSYFYNPTNVICGFDEIPDYTKIVSVQTANVFSDRHALDATYTFIRRQFVSGSVGGAGYYTIEALTGNKSYSNLTVTAWIESGSGTVLTDITTLFSGAYVAGQTIVSSYNHNLWVKNGSQLSLPVPSYDLVVVTYFNDAPSGTYFYVATTGSDSYSGSQSSPWGTIQYAVNHMTQGSTLYIRGGTYKPTATTGVGDAGTTYCGVYISNKNGSASSRYTVSNYPGETVVIEGSNVTTNSAKSGWCMNNCSYWTIKGINVGYFIQPTTGSYVDGVQLMSCSNITFENVASSYNGGAGFKTRLSSGEGIYFLNCDAFHNYDPYTATPGDNADGFDIGFAENDYTQTLENCRAGYNGDDGFDMFQYEGYTGKYILKGCWSFFNGFRPDGVTPAGDGTGFKYGADNWRVYDGIIRRTTTNCLAVGNRTRGFSQESANVRKIFYNNTAYLNGLTSYHAGFSFVYYDIPDIVRNNLAYGNYDDDAEAIGVNRIADHNSWDTAVMISAADFVSLDTSQLMTARGSDGSLPVITLLHLSAGSDLLDKGVDVGLPYGGTAPDLGCFER